MAHEAEDRDLIASAKSGNERDLSALRASVEADLRKRNLDLEEILQSLQVLQQHLPDFDGRTQDELLNWLARQVAVTDTLQPDGTLHADPQKRADTTVDQSAKTVGGSDKTVGNEILPDPNGTLGKSDQTVANQLPDPNATLGRSDQTLAETQKQPAAADQPQVSQHDVTMVRNDDTLGRADMTLARPEAIGPVGNNIHTAETMGAASDGSGSGLGGRPFGDYELLNMIAKGGMGVVYRARQRKLNRIVALKMILAGQFADDLDVKRFYAEAEAAAKLRHPNIVGIHEVGECEGQHFFSMEFIDGHSLSDLVRDNPLPPQQAAMLVRDVARAMQYAHDHDVLHRDLKPSNVLLDESNSPMITDFGLAKQVEGQSQLTMSGAIVGTPSYMPPEQAGAEADKVGVGSDVYSMGAILYELLAGTPPFRAATPFETIRQVLERDPISPRVVNSSVPVDLETICLKCLEKQPANRYASATELADELQRFLNNEPIHARPISSLNRAWRWCLKNKRLASLMSVAVVLLIAFVGSLIYTNNVRKRLLDKYDGALVQTLDAVNRLFVSVATERLLNEPGAKRLREELLMKARDIYQEIHKSESEDPRIRYQLALSYYQLGQIMDELRSPDAARESYLKGLAMQTELLQEEPGNQTYMLDLSNTQNKLGVLLGGRLERPEEGLAWLAKAKKVREQLVQLDHQNWEYARRLAAVYMSVGLLQKKQLKSNDARLSFEEAQTRRADLLAQLTSRLATTTQDKEKQRVRAVVPVLHQDLATGFHNLALLHRSDLQQAQRRVAQLAETRRKTQQDSQPWPPAEQQKLAKSIVAAKESRSRYIRMYEQAVAAMEQALSFNPKDQQNGYRKAVFQKVLGDALKEEVLEQTVNAQGEPQTVEHVVADLAAAQKNYELAQKELDRLVRRNPNASDYRFALAGLQKSLAVTLCETSQAKSGYEKFREAAAHLQQLTADFPEVPRYRFDLGKLRREFAYEQLLEIENRPAAKLAEWEKLIVQFENAESILVQLCKEFPNKKDYQHSLHREVEKDLEGIAKFLAGQGRAAAKSLEKNSQATPEKWQQALAWLARSKTIFDRLAARYQADKSRGPTLQKYAGIVAKTIAAIEKTRQQR